MLFSLHSYGSLYINRSKPRKIPQVTDTRNAAFLYAVSVYPVTFEHVLFAS